MTAKDQQKMFRHNLAIGVVNAHKHGLSWKHIHEILSMQTAMVWANHRSMLELFPENAKHSNKETVK